MYYERRKLLPILPKSFEDVLKTFFQPAGTKKMTYVYKQEEIIIVTCKKKYWITYKLEYFIDYIPYYTRIELELLFSFIHSFLRSKTESCYIKIWVNGTNVRMVLDQVFSINIIHLDFAVATYNNVQKNKKEK